jgi:hypothetical protein
VRPTATRFQRATELGIEAAWSYEAKLAAAYQSLIKQAADQAARMLPAVAMAAAGHKPSGAPEWSVPHAEELGSKLRQIYATDKKTGPIRVEAMRAASGPPLAVVGLSFSLRNPFIEGVLRQVGKSIDVTDTTRRQIMEVLDESWRKGDSVVHAGEALRAYGIDNSRGLLIARTELNAISNGGSMAAALTSARESDAQPDRDGLPPLLKLWLTAEDDRVRDTHVQAGDDYGAGSGIPLTDPFYVGGSELYYPGDPDGPADEICNCRCAISYEEAEGVTAAAPRHRMGARMSVIDQAAVDKARERTPGAEGAIAAEPMPEEAAAREWVGCLCLEGMSTNDHRFLALGSIGWRPLPLTLTAQLVTAEGHSQAVVAGRIDRIEKMPVADALAAGLVPEGRDYPEDAVAVIGYGAFAESEEGYAVEQLIGAGDLRGVSVELSVSEGELVELEPMADGEPGDLVDVTVAAEIATACIVAFPAFAEAQVMLATQAADGGLAADEDEAVAASAWRFSLITASPVRMLRPVTASAAGAAPVKPPLAWFADPELSEPTPMTVTAEGRVYGHLATWGVCHVGITDACVRPPRNSSGYRMFHLGELETAEGEFIAVGTLTMDTGHADLRLNAAATKRHYDDTGVGAIDCVVGEDRHGIWMAGAVRPELSMESVRRLRASKPSGDWRTVGGSFEMIGVLAVNTPGFPVPRPRARVLPALAAAGGERVTSLIAAGIDLAPSDDSTPDPAHLWRLFDRALPGSSAARVEALAASALSDAP